VSGIKRDPQITNIVRSWQRNDRPVICRCPSDDNRRPDWTLRTRLTLRSVDTLRPLRASARRALHALCASRSLIACRTLSTLRPLDTSIALRALWALSSLCSRSTIGGHKIFEPLFDPGFVNEMFVLLGLDEQGDVCV